MAQVKWRGRRQEKQRERETERWPVSSLSDRDKELSDKNGKKRRDGWREGGGIKEG